MRCNCGVNPIYLTDQWLIAEQVELLMVAGYLKRMNFQPRSTVPEIMQLGKGYILFWSNKTAYLRRRLQAVKAEVSRREFKVCDLDFDAYNIPSEFCNDWEPAKRDTIILRRRLNEKFFAKPTQWRYEREYITNPGRFMKRLTHSKVNNT